jgi:hypothetical protein
MNSSGSGANKIALDDEAALQPRRRQLEDSGMQWKSRVHQIDGSGEGNR